MLSTCGSVIFNLPLKFSDGKASPVLSAVALQISALIVVMIWWLSTLRTSTAEITLSDLTYPLLAGGIIGITNLLIVLMCHNQAPLNLAMPLTRVLGIALAALIGTVWLQEVMTVKKAISLSLARASIWLLLSKG